ARASPGVPVRRPSKSSLARMVRVDRMLSTSAESGRRTGTPKTRAESCCRVQNSSTTPVSGRGSTTGGGTWACTVAVPDRVRETTTRAPTVRRSPGVGDDIGRLYMLGSLPVRRVGAAARPGYARRHDGPGQVGAPAPPHHEDAEAP